MKSIFGISKIKDRETNAKISNYLTVFFNNRFIEENNPSNIYQWINKLKCEYEYVIFDTSSNLKYQYITSVLRNSKKIVFLMEPNLLGISKAKTMLEVLIMDLKIEVDKIKILFNKTNKYHIDEDIIKEIFSEFECIGNIKYDERYDLMINKNLNLFDIENIFKIIYENEVV